MDIFTHFESSDTRYGDSSLPIKYYKLPDLSSETTAFLWPNWHNDMEIIYSYAEVIIYIDGVRYVTSPGDVFFINPQQNHIAYRRGPGDFYAIVFDLNILKLSRDNDPFNSLLDDILTQRKCLLNKLPRESEIYLKAKELLSIVLQTESDTIDYGAIRYRILSKLYDIVAACFGCDCLEDASRINREGFRFIKDIIGYISKHYYDDLNVKILSQKLHISQSYIYFLFKSYVGISPVNYINSIRLREAYRLLDSGVSVTDTANEVGFTSSSYFIKVFKEATGVTPNKWRLKKGKKHYENKY